MPIAAGASNIRNILAALNIKEVWANGVQRFGPAPVPPGDLTVVNVQQGLVEGANTATWVVITDTPVTTTISNSPTGTNQMLAGAWIN